MKLIFLYASRGARNHTNWSNTKLSKSSIALQYTTDGYAHVANRLIEENVVDEVLTFVEVGRHHGVIKINDKHKVYAVPHITCAEEYIKPGDIIFVRGCWKHWSSICNKFYKKNWFIYYGAGTPRSGWPYWHVVYNDFVDKPVSGKHLTIPFIKPINTNIFYPISNNVKEYDIILNSCFHIYDKKGQYKLINAAVEYKKLFNKDLKIVMPGGAYRSTNTNKLPEVICKNKLKVDRPGTLSRTDLNTLLSKCKMYVHIGYGEQNARSALEAMRCGLPLYIANPHLWPPFVSNHPKVTLLCKDPNYYKQIAKDINKMLIDIDKGMYNKSTKHFNNCNSPEKLVDSLSNLISVMKNTKPSENFLKKLYLK